MSKPAKNNTIIIATVTGIVAIVAGYLLGAFVGFGGKGGSVSNSPDYAGTYITSSWNGRSGTLVLNSDGTCKLPSQFDPTCTYEVKDGIATFNGDVHYQATLGNEGLVYMDAYFTKLK